MTFSMLRFCLGGPGEAPAVGCDSSISEGIGSEDGNCARVVIGSVGVGAALAGDASGDGVGTGFEGF